MNVIAVVVTYNGSKWINKCITSLKTSSVQLKIIVIDNGSTDGTRQLLKNYDVDFIQAEENLGFAKANNVGIKLALQQNADYIFLLNQDAWIETDTIKHLISTSIKYPDYGVISPVHLNGSYNALDIKFANYLIPENCKRIMSDLYLNKPDEIYEAKFINAAAWLVTKDCLQKTGLFDPVFFFYGEDSNYLQRVLYHNFKIGIVPKTTICHDREVRQGKLNINNISRWERSQSLNILLNIQMTFKTSALLFFKEKIRLIARCMYEKKFSLVRYQFNEIFFFLTHIHKLKIIRKGYKQTQAF